MSTSRDDTALVGEDWRPSTIEDAGAAELAARIEAAPAVVVPRDALVGRCGLDDRDVWSLGVAREPAGLRSAGTGLGLRLAVVGAALAGTLLTLVAVLLTAGGSDAGDGARGTVGLVAFFAVAAYAVFRLAFAAAGRERERRLALRRVARPALAPLQDLHARLTVAVLDGPGVLRVLLVWLRGRVDAPDLLEVRVVAERRVGRDDDLAAEDAVDALSEIAMLAGRLREEPGVSSGSSGAALVARARDLGPALGGEASTEVDGDPAEVEPPDEGEVRLRGEDPAGAAGGAHARLRTPSRQRVRAGWRPDGTTAEGEAELARRLTLAAPRPWSGELLAPLVVRDVRQAGGEPARLPARTRRTAAAPRGAWVALPALVVAVFLVMAGISATAPGEEARSPGAVAFLVALGAAVAGWAWRPALAELPHRWRRRRLIATVDDAAQDAAAPLEGALPGGHGTVVVVRAARARHQLVRLVHLRRTHDAPAGSLEARTLAEERLPLEDADGARDAVGRFLLVAGDAAFVARRGRRSVAGLRSLARILGVRTPARGARPWREPVLVVAGLVTLAAVGVAVLGVVDATAGLDVVKPGESVVPLVALLAGTAGVLRACARRWRDVPGD